MDNHTETTVCHSEGLTLPSLFARRMQDMLGENSNS